jgi:hypothetical protein
MRESRNLGRLLGGIYGWILAVFLGAVLLDIVYSRLLEDVDGFLAGPSVYSEVADFLLLLGAVTILFGLAAIVVSWDVKSARNLFLASSMLLIGFEFLAPLVLFPVLRSSTGSYILGFGPWIRLVPTALASLLAFAGVRNLYGQRDTARPA